jgi:hypothetical protein
MEAQMRELEQLRSILAEKDNQLREAQSRLEVLPNLPQFLSSSPSKNKTMTSNILLPPYKS